jgi:hypothetical protein
MSSKASWLLVTAHETAYDSISDTVERSVGDHESGDRPPLKVAEIPISLSAGWLDRGCRVLLTLTRCRPWRKRQSDLERALRTI